jgi:hypothetical protein
MAIEHEFLEQVENKWQNVYWFARMLISNDKYGRIGKENDLLSKIASSLRVVKKENDKLEPSETLALQKQSLKNILLDRVKNAPARQQRVERLIEDLDYQIDTAQDMEVFILTCENIMLPINNAIDNIPSDDKEFTQSIARSYLDLKGEEGLATVINLWDDLGTRGCLTAERTEIVKAYATLRVLLDKRNNLSDDDKDIIKTAFVQEFERRAGQKRKGRAGGSLEDVTSFILKYFGIKSTSAPEHFQADIEVDNWVKTKDSWLIGISCKRTLRERWKQVSSADSGTLSKFKIKQLFHVLTYDEDLSDDKLSLLGDQRHIFYLPDNSRRLEYASQHVGLKDYVRPISKLIEDLKKETG